MSLSLSSCRCPLPRLPWLLQQTHPSPVHTLQPLSNIMILTLERNWVPFYILLSQKGHFFTFPQSEASRNRTINLRKGFHQDRWSSQETTLFQAEIQRTNKQSVLLRHPSLVTCPQLHLFNVRGLGQGRGCGCRSR